MRIICDVAQKNGKHDEKHKQLTGMGFDLVTMPLPVADYIMATQKVEDAIHRKESRGIPIKKMDFLGTYNVAIDSKYGIQEIIGDVCGKDHARFRDELILARNCGIKIYVLIEDDGGCVCKSKGLYNKPVRSIDDLYHWINPRLFIWNFGRQAYPNATKGKTLAKALQTIESEYGCKFVFCSKHETGKKIVELLKGG